MKLKDALIKLGSVDSVKIAEKIAEKLNIHWVKVAQYVFSSIAKDPERAPNNIGGKNDDESDVIEKWLIKYINGYKGRATRRISKPPGTVADPILDNIIGMRINSLETDDLNKISHAHRISMSAENILGLILEEYLSVNLKDHGWHCAWGETVKSVDFVHEDGRLLQIKNRSNSENSSSSAVRDGTTIEKWYRIKADRIEYMWDALNAICGTKHLSESEFVKFAEKCVKDNPECLAIESANPWDV